MVRERDFFITNSMIKRQQKVIIARKLFIELKS